MSDLGEFETGDHAFTASETRGRWTAPMYSGALSFMRRRYSRDLAGVDVAITGIPFDLATSHRPGRGTRRSVWVGRRRGRSAYREPWGAGGQ